MKEDLSARQFIYFHYPKWADGIDNGYYIMPDEKELLEMMETYAKFKSQVANDYYLSAMQFIEKETGKYFPDTSKIHALAVEIIETNTIKF